MKAKKILDKLSAGSITFAIMVSTIVGCKKLVDVNPPVTSLSSASVFSSDATAVSAVTSIYTDMASGGTGSAGNFDSMSLFGGLSADELTLYSGVINQQLLSYYRNNLSSSTRYGTEFWTQDYSYIYRCNSAIAGLNASTSITPAIKQQLLGEAEFLRGLFYFYLVNLYGDVPLAQTTDYKTNSTLPRIAASQIYQQIINDLNDAQRRLSSNYMGSTLLNNTTEKVRPTKWAALALLARVELFAAGQGNNTGYYSKADSASTAVIANPGFALSPLSGSTAVFTKNSQEAIWQLQPVNINWNTEDAKIFVVPATGPNTGTQTGALLSPFLLNSFESGDQRYNNWVGSVQVAGTTYYFPYKYKVNTSGQPVSEYIMVLRLAEQYLIRAEARTKEGNITGAQNDLNTIRTRAGLPNILATTQAALLAAVLHERQIELFAELGQRWMDLKRTGNVDNVMGNPGGVCAAKGGTWSSNWQLYPVPLIDLQNDANLQQNAGY